jgi:hypothetical protein
MDALTYRMH